jgi:NAD(P)-dependent dehydrogenase (short-subunit alcohol dehydrogenase family)
MSPPVILILGAGANIGAAVARKFSQEGYKVAAAARNVHKDVADTSDLTIKADFSDPTSIKGVFDEVTSKVGIPNVVLYNAATVKPTAPNDTLSVPLEDYTTSMNIGVNSAFAAAQQAVLGFAQLPSDVQKSFIFTGNILNTTVMTPLLTLGIPKAAAAHMIQAAAQSYADKGYHFYYGDERTAEGKPAMSALSGEGHATFYWELSQKKDQGPWAATFVTGKGYIDFGGK